MNKKPISIINIIYNDFLPRLFLLFNCLFYEIFFFNIHIELFCNY